MAKAVDKAYQTVRERIVRGVYPASSRITEQEVAAVAGVSRTPVREALRKLHAEGLLEFVPHQGAIVTDWGVMSGAKDEGAFIATAWGAEDITPAERYFTVLKNTVDMFGGVNDATHILEAYDLWNERYAAGEVEVDADTRWAESGARILTAYFAPGLFDVISVITALFPFDPALRALTGALDAAGPSIGIAILHLAILTIAYGALARLAVRRFTRAFPRIPASGSQGTGGPSFSSPHFQREPMKRLVSTLAAACLLATAAPALADDPPPPLPDNGLARTPPMGWNSWNKFACNVDETLIKRMADAMVSESAAHPATFTTGRPLRDRQPDPRRPPGLPSSYCNPTAAVGLGAAAGMPP